MENCTVGAMVTVCFPLGINWAGQFLAFSLFSSGRYFSVQSFSAHYVVELDVLFRPDLFFTHDLDSEGQNVPFWVIFVIYAINNAISMVIFAIYDEKCP